MSYFIPILIILLLVYALLRRVDPYSAFVEGASEALPTLVKLLPNLAAMLVAIGVFRASGGMDRLAGLLAPAFSHAGIPSELTPLIVIRPFSGSAALAALSDTLASHGTDSFIGLAASVCTGSRETLFYTFSLYCGAVGIKKTRYAFLAALVGDIVGILSALIFVRLLLF